jgi:hypothetical protein
MVQTSVEDVVDQQYVASADVETQLFREDEFARHSRGAVA